jgi:hypothetical protein
MAESDVALPLSTISRLNTLLESLNNRFSVPNVGGVASPFMQQGALWQPGVMAAQALGTIPGTAAAFGQMMMPSAFPLLQGPRYSQFEASRMFGMMNANQLASQESLKPTLERFGMGQYAGATSQLLRMVNMVAPDMGKTIDSVMATLFNKTYFTGEATNLLQQGLSFANPSLRLNPGEMTRVLGDEMASIRNFVAETGYDATEGALGKALSTFSGTKDLAGATGFGRMLSREFGIGGEQIAAIAKRAGPGGFSRLTDLFARSKVYSEYSGVGVGGAAQFGQQLAQGLGINTETGIGIASRLSMGLVAAGTSSRMDAGEFMQAAAGTMGGNDADIMAAMAEQDPAMAAKAVQAAQSGDMATYRRLLMQFQRSKGAASIGYADKRALGAVLSARGMDPDAGWVAIGRGEADRQVRATGRRGTPSVGSLSTSQLEQLVDANLNTQGIMGQLGIVGPARQAYRSAAALELQRRGVNNAAVNAEIAKVKDSAVPNADGDNKKEAADRMAGAVTEAAKAAEAFFKNPSMDSALKALESVFKTLQMGQLPVALTTGAAN